MARRHAARPGYGPQRRHRTYSGAVTYVYGAAILNGVLRPDDSAIREIEDAVHGVEQFGDEFALAIARLTLGLALLNRRADPERDRGQKLLADVSDMFLSEGHNLGELPIVNVYLARERARRGDRDKAIPLMHVATDHLFHAGPFGYCIPASAALVETLLERGTRADVVEAEAAIEQLAAAPADDGLVIREIWLLRSRAASSAPTESRFSIFRRPKPLREVAVGSVTGVRLWEADAVATLRSRGRHQCRSPLLVEARPRWRRHVPFVIGVNVSGLVGRHCHASGTASL